MVGAPTERLEDEHLECPRQEISVWSRFRCSHRWSILSIIDGGRKIQLHSLFLRRGLIGVSSRSGRTRPRASNALMTNELRSDGGAPDNVVREPDDQRDREW